MKYQDALNFIDDIGIWNKIIADNYPIHSVLYWCGNSTPTYLMYVTGSDFAVREISDYGASNYYTHYGNEIRVCHKLDSSKVEVRYCRQNNE